MDYWMLVTDFKNRPDFNIYHFTGDKIDRHGKGKISYIYDKIISIDEMLEPRIIKNNGNFGKKSDDLEKHFININYLQDEERYYLLKLMFQPALELG
jgi:hypothetical protein